MTTPLSAAMGGAFTVSGTDFPGQAGDAASITLSSVDGLPLRADCGVSLTVPATRALASALDGVLPPFAGLRDVDVRVSVLFLDGSTAVSSGALATILGTPDPALDQDEDGIADPCDPDTYTFEGDAPGANPAGTTAVDGPLGFVAVAREGQQSAAFNGVAGGTVAYQAFDRLEADFSQQDLSVYLDVDASAGYLTLDLWDEGSFSGASGSSLLFQVSPTGACTFYERVANSILVAVGAGVAPTSGRFRLDLRKGAGTTSSLSVAQHDGSTWQEAVAVYGVLDDRAYRGLSTCLSNYAAGARGVKRISVVREIPPAALTLAKRPGRSMDWQVFQREGAGGAEIPLRLLYRFPAGGLAQARVVRSATGEVLVGHDWPDHAATLPAADGATFDLPVPDVPTGGNYDVQVRVLDAGSVVLAQSALLDVAVGDVWIAAGQSNMSGYPGTVLGAEAPIAEAHVFHSDGTWQQAREPMDDGVGQLDLVSREFPAASCLLAFAKRLHEQTGVPVGVVPASLGGTNLYGQWQRYAVHPAARQTLYGSMLARARRASVGAPPRGLLWFQGESDALSGRTTAQYRADLQALVDQLRGDLAAPGLVALIGQLGCFLSADLALWLPVQEAQRQMAESDPSAALLTAVDLPLADPIHFSVAGYRTMGARFAQAAQRRVFDATTEAYPRLLSASGPVGGAQVVLTYDGGVAGGDPALFSLADASGPAAVSSVNATGSTVTLTLARPLDVGAALTYGLSTNPAAAWVKRVSDGAPAACLSALALAP